MAVHDWTRVSAGTFHDFHTVWMAALRTAMNERILPADYYALCEQSAGDIGPDVLTLRTTAGGDADGGAAAAVAEAPPQVQFTASTEMDLYRLKQRTLAIRHSSDDRIIALLEILSPGNKSSRQAFRAFLDKAVSALAHGYHLLVIDLQPLSKRDPQGIHGAIRAGICDDAYVAPREKPLTLAAYSAGPLKNAYVVPVAVGNTLPDMPLFLTPEDYVPVPLEATYDAAWRGGRNGGGRF